jgi:predicted aconitase
LQIAPAFVGKQLKKRTLFSMVPMELERLKAYDEYEQLQLAGVEFVPACPLTYLTVRNDNLKNVLTDSGKLHYYLSGAQFANTQDCLREAGIA